MRPITLATSFLALIAAVPALADEVYTQAPVTAVTVYPDGAELLHRASLDLPAGSHRVYLPYGSTGDLSALPRIRSSDGVSIEGLSFLNDMAVDPEALYTPAQAEAWSAVEAAKTTLAARTDALAAAQAQVKSLKARGAYFAAMTPGSDMSAEALVAMADTVSREVAANEAALAEAEASLRPLEDELTKTEATLDAARVAFDRLSPPQTTADLIAVDLSLAATGPVTLELTEFTYQAGWMMDYDLDLDRAAGKLDIDRKVVVQQYTGTPWSDVALTLSTARPGEAVGPADLYPDNPRLYEDMPVYRGSGVADVAPMVEAAPAMLDQAASPMPELRIDGLALSYAYPQSVTIMSDDAAELSLDRLSFDAEVAIHANPRSDSTAFTVATFTNGTAEPILPGSANVLRDGHLVGRTEIAMIPAGAEETLAFGAIEGLRLSRVIDRNAEGDTGIISKSNTREQRVTFAVENLTGEEQSLTAFYALPFSEQEDLKVKVTANPAPNETDIDRMRGVSAWDMVLAPGEKQEVVVDMRFDWPEDQNLSWYP